MDQPKNEDAGPDQLEKSRSQSEENENQSMLDMMRESDASRAKNSAVQGNRAGEAQLEVPEEQKVQSLIIEEVKEEEEKEDPQKEAVTPNPEAEVPKADGEPDIQKEQEIVNGDINRNQAAQEGAPNPEIHQGNNHQEGQTQIERVILNEQPKNSNPKEANPNENNPPASIINARENHLDELKNKLVLFGENIIRTSLGFINKYAKLREKKNLPVVIFFSLVIPIILAVLLGKSSAPEIPMIYRADFELTDPLHIELKDLDSDIYNMPECSERNLLRLIFYTKSRNLNNTHFLNSLYTRISDSWNVTMETEFQLLRENLKKEELDSEGNQEALMKIQEKVLKNHWNDASQELEDLLKELRPLNTNELYRLILKANEVAGFIKDQDIVLFLGPSGSGKSTTIHFLGGSEMTEIKEDGIDHIAPTKIKNPALKQVFTSSTSTSQTKYITRVPVSFQEIDKQLNGTTILCDSPGFDDTNGAEVDIANQVGIIKALQMCKSVKPVIVISREGLGDKLKGLKDLIRTVATMIPKVKYQSDAFFYFFTKFSDKDKNQIHAKLQDLKRTLSLAEKSNTNLVDLINDLLEKTAKGPIIIDPINNKPGILLKKLQESPAILYPGQIFQYSISQNSQLTIKEQTERFKTSIKSSIVRFDFSLAKYKLDELKNLYEALGDDHINITYANSVEYCTKKLNEVYSTGITNLNKCFIEKNSLEIEDVRQFKEHLEIAKNAESITKAHLSKATTQELCQNIQQETKKLLSSLNNRRVNEPGVNVTLDKLKLLSTHFSEVSIGYDEGCKKINKTINDTVISFQNSVERDQFEKSGNEMQILTQAKSILKDHISSSHLEKTYQDLRKFLFTSLNNCTEGPNSVFAKEILDNNDILALSKCISRIDVANKTQSLKKHISTKNMNELYGTLFERLLNHSKEVDSKMTVYFKKEHENSLKKLERLMEEMTLILTLPSMDSELAQTYHTTLGKLEKVMLESKTQIEHILSLIPKRKHAVIPEVEPESEPEAEPKREEETEQNEVESSSPLEAASEASESHFGDIEPEAEDIIFLAAVELKQSNNFNQEIEKSNSGINLTMTSLWWLGFILISAILF